MNFGRGGATPLDPDEAQGLIPGLTTQEQLNEFEQANIVRALSWCRRSKKLKKDFLCLESLKLLHKRMFDQTWEWAGEFRKSDKGFGNRLGAPWYQIGTDLKNVCDDTKFWINDEIYPVEEIAIRFHHRLVLVHPFPNGNGRHARLAADLLMYFAGKPMFTWGRFSSTNDQNRKDYIGALQQADANIYDALIEFAMGSSS